ncbi:MAG: Stk1 family PASTA domain-containing Ser/Thr kinase [Oscillospiraceae bacterium]
MDLNIGEKMDNRYEITDLIGVGGMADVYKAVDLMENKIVAVKILKPEFADNEEFLRKFRNESKAIAMLSHPNIVKIYDVGLKDSVKFIVMEYIDGITLKEYIDQQGVLKWEDALNFTSQILKALQHAHDKGIVHRDIKPQNIMLLEDGTIKVMDFGIARFSRIDGKTLSEKTIGSVHYISPEQAKGELTDERSDIYSVGIMLYEMLTGVKPFDGDNPVAIAMKHLEETPVAPRERNPEIPTGLEEIVLHAMEREPSKRYQSASEMIKDIDAFKNDPQITFNYNNDDDSDGKTKFFSTVKDLDISESNKPITDTVIKEEKVPEKKRSYTIPILLSVAVAAVIVATILISYFVISNLGTGNHTGNVELENFVGQNIVDVEQKYNGKLKFDISQEYNDQYDEGIIFEQSQSPGQIVREGYTLSIKVSRGKRVLTIPDIVNKKASIAQSELTSAGFTPVVRETYDNNVAQGLVIRTEPAAGTEAPADSEVLIMVSKGPFQTDLKVPNVIGLTKEKAIAKLTESKVEYKIETIAHEGDKNKVIEQSVKAGEYISRDTTLTVFISTGEADPVDVTINMPMPQGIWGAYMVEVYRDGNVIASQNISDGQTVAGGSINITLRGTKKESLTVKITNSTTNQSVQYARYNVDYLNEKYDLDGSLNESGLLGITPKMPDSSKDDEPQTNSQQSDNNQQTNTNQAENQ